ncbi:MAG: glycerate kinase [Desulfovibrio sp.]
MNLNAACNHPRQQDDLLYIVERAIGAVSPDAAMHRTVCRQGDLLTVADREYDLSRYARVLAVGAGKASAPMALALEEILGERLEGGVVATKYGHGLDLSRIRILESGHPVPDLAGQAAAAELLQVAEQAGERDLVFLLLSGGASALVPAPRGPVALAHKQETTRLLLECGADINEINAVRKHLSLLKGGHLARTMEPATVVTLIISDVVGDRLDVIGSGPTAPDASSFGECLAILERHALRSRVPAAVLELLEQGAAGHVPETCKSGDVCFLRVQNEIIASNVMALEGAAQAARERGYKPVVLTSAMRGEARDVARSLVLTARDACARLAADSAPLCLLAGGETTVTIRGQGRGGRNQEMALAAALALAELPDCRERVAVACVGTDGSDGPTDAAGALVLPDTLSRGDAGGLCALAHLADNNAYEYFSGAGTILRTGPTRTNVMDVAALLVYPA